MKDMKRWIIINVSERDEGHEEMNYYKCKWESWNELDETTPTHPTQIRLHSPGRLSQFTVVQWRTFR